MQPPRPIVKNSARGKRWHERPSSGTALVSCSARQSKEKYFDPDLAEHAADLYEVLTKATTRGWRWRNLLIACFTLKALLKALNCHRIELRRMNMNRRFLVMMLLGGFAATCVGAYIEGGLRTISTSRSPTITRCSGAGRALILSMSLASSIRREGTAGVTCT